MFKHNGTGTHFWITEGVLQPLLEWRTTDGHALELSGRTFACKATGNQWFKQLVVAQDGDVLLELTAQSADNRRRTMVVKRRRGELPKGISVKEATEGLLSFEASGVAFEVKSASAAKFARKDAARDKYHHLNVGFESGIPPGVHATGIFAQLAGLEPMLAATKEMLKPPTAL